MECTLGIITNIVILSLLLQDILVYLLHIFFRQAIIKQLDDNGYCVVPNVITSEKCDEYLQDFQKWHSSFKENGKELRIRRSVIQSYRIGHCESAWKCRLHCKPVFDLLWGTEKLLTSVDGVAISTPPKKGKANLLY